MRFFRKIVGERLYLSPFNPEDVESYTKWAEWMNDRTVTDYYGGHNNLVSLASAKKAVEELKGHRFDIILIDSDILIGHISLHDIDHFNRNAFIGIVIGENEYRNRGTCGNTLSTILKPMIQQYFLI
jgi:RimJ/RimL family protein N-acetyltransferase